MEGILNLCIITKKFEIKANNKIGKPSSPKSRLGRRKGIF